MIHKEHMMLKRRNFMIGTLGLGLSPYLKAKEANHFEKDFSKVKRLISAVQVHMFPEGSLLPSSITMKSINFLFETVAHPSYDKDIRAFVLEGTEELADRTDSKFVTMTHSAKEKALRDYEATGYGSSWLSRIMTLTMEGMFGDPMYGSNTQEVGWKALHSFAGEPRPKARYLENV